jgi:hypothetical protein
MSEILSYIKTIEDSFPLLCTANDLVKIGLIKSHAMAYYLRRTGRGPEFLKMTNRSILYPKDAVIKYLRDGIHEA